MDPLDYGPIVLHLADRRVERPDGAPSLTSNEADALAYLARHLGEVVSRQHLERDVWHLDPNVRSETVPVTMRRLRKKIETDPKNPAILITERGRGWSLRPPRDRSPRIPRPATPLLERPAQTAALTDLLQRYRCVTVVGPGGIGKTRTAIALADAWSGEVFYIAVGAQRTLDDLHHALAMQLGVADGVELADVLAHRRDALVVLDEAELLLDEVRTFVEPLPRVLVTSRRPLGLTGEAVYELPALSVEEGRRFLDQRRRASRWHRNTSEAVADRLVDAVDGVPLALELALAEPQDLEELVQTLTTSSPDALPQIDATLLRSWDRLTVDERRTLAALVQFADTFSTRQTHEWLGVVDLAALADRSWLTWEDGRWRILRTSRVFIRRQPADWAALKRSYRTWLADHLDGLHVAITTDLAAARRDFGPLVPDALAWFEEEPGAAVQVVPALHFWFTYQGHRTQGRRLLRRALDQADTGPLVRGIAAIEALGSVDEHIAALDESSDARAHQLAMIARMRRGVRYVRTDLERVAGRLGEPLGPCALLTWLIWFTSHGHDLQGSDLEAFRVSAPPGGHYDASTIGATIHARYREAGLDAAREVCETSITTSRAGIVWNGRCTFIALLLIEGPEEALQKARELLSLAREVGDREYVVVSQSFVAVALFRLGRDEACTAALDAVDEEIARRIRDTHLRIQLLRALLDGAAVPEGHEREVEAYRALNRGEPDAAKLPQPRGLLAGWLVRHLHELAAERA